MALALLQSTLRIADLIMIVTIATSESFNDLMVRSKEFAERKMDVSKFVEFSLSVNLRFDFPVFFLILEASFSFEVLRLKLLRRCYSASLTNLMTAMLPFSNSTVETGISAGCSLNPVKYLYKCIQTLAKLNEEIILEANPFEFQFSSINATRTATLTLKFKKAFFDFFRYNTNGGRTTSILLQSENRTISCKLVAKVSNH